MVSYRFGASKQVGKTRILALKNDLSTSIFRNRRVRPWVIVFGHRPMYCSEGWWDCANNQTKTQYGIQIDGKLKYGLEEVLLDYQVDVAIWAHKHAYERLWPIYNYTFYKKNKPYINAKAPIHITTGSAGNSEGKGYISKTHPKYIAKHSNDYGYLMISVHNLTHLQFDYISTEKVRFFSIQCSAALC